MRILLLVACLSTLACTGAPTAPTLPALGSGANSGTWTGSADDRLNGEGRLRLDLEETPFGTTGLLTGTWSVTYPDPSKNAGGSIGGGVTASNVLLTLRRANPPICPGSGPGLAEVGTYQTPSLRLTGSVMAGSYEYRTCGAPVPGELTLTRQ